MTAVCYSLNWLEKLSDRDWHFLLRCIEVSQSVLCDQSPAECQRVKICHSLLLQHCDTQVSACSSATNVSTFPVRPFSGLQTYKHQRKIKMYTRLCVIEGNCLYVGVFCLDVCNIELCWCAGVHTVSRTGRTRSFVSNANKAGSKTSIVQNVTTNPHFN